MGNCWLFSWNWLKDKFWEKSSQALNQSSRCFPEPRLFHSQFQTRKEKKKPRLQEFFHSCWQWLLQLEVCICTLSVFQEKKQHFICGLLWLSGSDTQTEPFFCSARVAVVKSKFWLSVPIEAQNLLIEFSNWNFGFFGKLCGWWSTPSWPGWVLCPKGDRDRHCFGHDTVWLKYCWQSNIKSQKIRCFEKEHASNPRA